MAEGGEEAGERLRRALGAARDCEVVAALELCADRKRCRHSRRGEDVVVGVGVSPQLDLLRHRGDANSECLCSPGLS